MSEPLIRLIYASKSALDVQDMKKNLNEILLVSQRNNVRRRIGGVLCFGNGYFLQCIEGPNEEIKRLHETLLKDPRHHHLVELAMYPIERSIFAQWKMKYIRLDDSLQNFLSQHHALPFNPVNFSAQTVDELVDHLYHHIDQSHALVVSDISDQHQSVHSDMLIRPNISQLFLLVLVTIFIVLLIGMMMLG